MLSGAGAWSGRSLGRTAVECEEPDAVPPPASARQSRSMFAAPQRMSYLARVTLPHLLAGAAGLGLIFIIVWDAIETVLLPRRIGRRVRLTRYFYIILWRVWRALAAGVRRPARREAFLGFFGPL